MPRPEPPAPLPPHAPPLGHAVALGLIHGPAELLPVSSSAHVAVVPWLLGRPVPEVDRELEKVLEVALHAGTAAGLLLALRRDVIATLRGLDLRRLTVGGLATAVPAAVALAFERPIEQRLGGPGSVAAGLLVGSAGLVWAEATRTGRRPREAAGARDGLLLGLAQAAALAPGVSRSAATLTVARRLRFSPADGAAISRELALPIIAGATALKGARLAGRARAGDLPPGTFASIAAGAGAAFASALAAARLLPALERERALLAFAAYRTALAGLVLRRLWLNRRP